MGKVTIQKSPFNLPHGEKGIIAVFMYVGDDDPVGILDDAVRKYTENVGYHEFIDHNMDTPWIRVVVSEIDAADQLEFNPEQDRLKTDISRCTGIIDTNQWHHKTEMAWSQATSLH